MSREMFSEWKSLFRFPFQGPDWQSRFLIGSALLFAGWLIPLLPAFFVFGYAVEVMRRVIGGEEPRLPPWQDWGRLLVDGLRAFGVSFIYLLPGSVVYWGSIGLYLISSFLLPFMPPSMETEKWAALLLIVALFLPGLFLLLGLFLGSLLYVVGGVPLPMATAHFVAEDRFAAAFHFRRWWAILKERRWEYFVAWVFLCGLAAIAYFAVMMLYFTLFLCWLIPVLMAPLAFYLMVVSAALFGQVYGGSGTAGDVRR